jgi:hypothetical protein
VPHMFHGAVIAFFESVAKITPGIFALDGWMLVGIVIIGVGMAVVLEVAARGFDTFVEALALGIPISVRRAVPVAILVLILSRSWYGLCFVSAGFHRGRSGDAEGKSGN